MLVFPKIVLNQCKYARWSSHKACIVYITKVTNPYQNLAFESWMYEKVDFSKHNCLFIWRNQPSVVIGRHQNPWKECNVDVIRKNGVNICRRSSGGGAVYHDLGNMNFTFFTDRKTYNRKYNLNIIVAALKQRWPLLDVEVNKRDDIILNQKFKISGTSSKLGQKSTYHHCTLLINSNTGDVVKNLSPSGYIVSKATESVRSQVINLADVDETIMCDNVQDSVASLYIGEHLSGKVYEIDTNDKVLMPGISKIAEDLQSWKWIYGKTPDFSAIKKYSDHEFGLRSIALHIKNGLINEVNIDISTCNQVNISMLRNHLKNVPYSKEAITANLKVNPVGNDNDIELYNCLCGEIINLL